PARVSRLWAGTKGGNNVEKYRFFSEEWVAKFCEAINQSAAYREAAAEWEWPLVLVLTKSAEIGYPEDQGIWLDLYHGECRRASIVRGEEAQQAPYVVSGDYYTWKQILNKELDPIRAIVLGRLRLQGDIGVIVRFARGAQELVEAARTIPTEFPDERGGP
ncbi:MAG: SCP2 sterol-binding domain-containing protein, partial [Armatimonadota bacterium]|nr:SCP2 sterol-binding domain-containing protein [Armatimonadota bacterium]